MTTWQPRLGDPVMVFPDSPLSVSGHIVDDFGDGPTFGVNIGDGETIKPARRWAVQTDDGGLVFVDSDDLARALAD